MCARGLVLGVLLVCQVVTAFDWSAVLSSSGTWSVEKGFKSNGAAWAFYKDNINTTGWCDLSIETNGDFNDTTQAFAAGYLEGALTHTRIHEAYLNFMETYHYNDSLPESILSFVTKQTTWLRTQAEKFRFVPGHLNGGIDDVSYWHHADISLHQLDGMYLGYRHYCDQGKELNFNQFYILTNMGDLEDLQVAFPPSASDSTPTTTTTTTTTKPANHQHFYRSHPDVPMDCSACVKLTDDFRELFVGHTTFNAYQFMLRVFKHYEFHLHNTHTHAQTVSFSARPGDLESKDDYWLLDSGLVVVETSLAIFDKSLYSALNPHSVPCWLRINIANRMSGSALEWTQIFTQHNSGTHNNQWVIVDYNLFTPGNQPSPNTVMLLEQIPGHIQSGDVTPIVIRTHYFASYNIPYYPYIFIASGYAANNYSYTNDSRALMFRHDQGNVKNLEDMKWMMNSNDPQHDPYSGGSACTAISARCDIGAGGYAFGGIDSKVTSYERSKKMHTVAISSPSHQTLAPFMWITEFASVPHHGMPLKWDFDWTEKKPHKFE